MKPIKDRVLIKEIKTETITKSGLILPDNVKDKEYEVIEVGCKCKALKKGDKIVLHEHVKKLPYEDFYFINESTDIKVVL